MVQNPMDCVDRVARDFFFSGFAVDGVSVERGLLSLIFLDIFGQMSLINQFHEMSPQGLTIVGQMPAVLMVFASEILTAVGRIAVHGTRWQEEGLVPHLL